MRGAPDAKHDRETAAGRAALVARALREAVADKQRLADEVRRQAAVLHDLAGATGALAAGLHHLRALVEDEAARLSPGGAAALQAELEALDEIVGHLRALHARARMGRSAAASPARPRRLADEIAAVVEVVRRDLPPGVHLSVRCPPDAWTPADGIDLRRILLNLIRNAVQACESTGAGGHVCVAAAVEGDEVAVRVLDDGPGVPPALRERIFDRAWTSRSERGGQGLGLSICRELAAAQGGTVALDTSRVVGAGFVLRLPRVAPPDAPPPQSEPDLAPSFFRSAG